MVKACFRLETNSGSIPPPLPLSQSLWEEERARRQQIKFAPDGKVRIATEAQVILMTERRRSWSFRFIQFPRRHFRRENRRISTECRRPFPRKRGLPRVTTATPVSKVRPARSRFLRKKNVGQVILTFLLPPYSQVMEGRAPTAGVNAEATTTEISWMPAARPPDAHLPRAAPTYLDPPPTVRFFLGGLDGGKGVVDGKRPPRSNVLF